MCVSVCVNFKCIAIYIWVIVNQKVTNKYNCIWVFQMMYFSIFYFFFFFLSEFCVHKSRQQWIHLQFYNLVHHIFGNCTLLTCKLQENCVIQKATKFFSVLPQETRLGNWSIQSLQNIYIHISTNHQTLLPLW